MSVMIVADTAIDKTVALHFLIRKLHGGFVNYEYLDQFGLELFKMNNLAHNTRYANSPHIEKEVLPEDFKYKFIGTSVDSVKVDVSVHFNDQPLAVKCGLIKAAHSVLYNCDEADPLPVVFKTLEDTIRVAERQFIECFAEYKSAPWGA